MKTLLLYTTTGCHLCDEAEIQLNALCEPLPGKAIIHWKPVEISDSDELIEEYGLRIPVVKNEVSGQELGWPFELDELHQWLNDGFTI